MIVLLLRKLSISRAHYRREKMFSLSCFFSSKVFGDTLEFYEMVEEVKSHKSRIDHSGGQMSYQHIL